MNRTDSLKVINAFITELGAPAKSVAPAPKAAATPEPAYKAVVKAESAPLPPRAPAAPSAPRSGLGELMAGCTGFEIGAVPQAAPGAVPQGGLVSLIQGCAGFEIGSAAAAPACEPAATAETVKPVAPVEPTSAVAGPAVDKVAAETVAPPAEPPVEITPETAAARKALASLSNKPLLLSLLQYYASESQRPNPSRSMLKTTKEQVMKHWPQLTLTPLISALDGAAG